MTTFTLFVVLVANFECAALLQNKNTRIGPFPWKRSVLQNPDQERTNQSTGICLGLGLPYKARVLSERYNKERERLQNVKQ